MLQNFPPETEFPPFTQRPEAYHPGSTTENPLINIQHLYNMWREEILGIFSDIGYPINYDIGLLNRQCFTRDDIIYVMDQLLPLRTHVDFIINRMRIIDNNLHNLIVKLNNILEDILMGFRLPYYRNTNANPHFEMIFLKNLDIAYKMIKSRMVVSEANEEIFLTKQISIQITLFITGFLNLFNQPVTTQENSYITQEDFNRFRDFINQIIAVLIQTNTPATLFSSVIELNKKKDNTIDALNVKNAELEYDNNRLRNEIMRLHQVLETKQVSDIMSTEHVRALERITQLETDATVINKHNEELVAINEALNEQIKQFHERIANQDKILNELRETERKYNELITISEAQQQANEALKENINALHTEQEGGIATINNLKEQIEVLKESIRQERTIGEQYTEERMSLNKRIMEQTAEIQSLHVRIESLNEEIEQMQEQNENYLLEQNRLKAIVVALNQRIAELNQQLADQELLKERVQQLNNEVQQRIERENNMNVTIEEQLAEKEQLQEILNQINQVSTDRNQQNENLKNKMQSGQKELNRLYEEVNNYVEKISELNNLIAKNNNQINNLKFENGHLKTDTKRLSNLVQGYEKENKELSKANAAYQNEKQKLTQKVGELETQVNSLLKEKTQLQDSINTTLRDQKLLSQQQEILKDKLRNHDSDLEEANKFLDDELKKYESMNSGYKATHNDNDYINYANWISKQGEFVNDLVTDLDVWRDQLVSNGFNKLIPDEGYITPITLIAYKYMTQIHNAYVYKYRETSEEKDKLLQKTEDMLNKYKREMKIINTRYDNNKKKLVKLLKEKKAGKFNN